MANKKKNKESKKSEQVKQIIAKKNSNTLLACICAAVIALTTYFVFSPSLDDGFTNWDDPTYVQENPLVVNNSVPLIKIFETPVSLHYHPLTVLSLALNYQTGKLDPSGYHLWNVLLHVLNTILVFVFIFLLTRCNLLIAAIVSLFFGIHPMHVESVAWVSERKDVLYVFFFIAGLIAYLRYSETKKIAWYIFTFLLFTFSCLSKEMAIVFPVILLLIDYLKGVKLERRLFLEKIPFFFLAIVFGIIAAMPQLYPTALVKIQSGESGAPTELFTFFQRILFASYSAIMYIIKLFAPVNLSAFYPFPNTHGPEGIPLIFYLSPLVLISILCSVAYFFLKKEREMVFGLLFYFVSLSTVIQFVPLNPYIIPDRYSYLSYVGLSFAVAYIINKAWKSKNRIWVSLKYPFIIIAIIGAVIFSSQTYSRTQVWKNSETLWTDAIDNYPETPFVYKMRGDYYCFTGHEPEKAIADYNKAIELDPTFKKTYINRGTVYLNTGRMDLALADFTKAIELDSTYPESYLDCGNVYEDYRKSNLALSDYNRAIALDSTFTQAYYDRGLLFFHNNRNDLAIADFTKTIELDPTFKLAYYDRGIAYSSYNNNDLAIADYTKAIELDSTFKDAYNNRGTIYTDEGKNDLAIYDFNKVISLDPSYANAVNNIGLIYLRTGKYDMAITYFSRAIEINPSAPVFWLNRSLAEDKIGQSENAKADALKGQQLQGK